MTQPAYDQDHKAISDHLVVTPFYKDEKTGAIYVHQDLTQRQNPWEEEQHIGPVKADHAFGDVESFVAYVGRYSEPATTLITWNAKGLRAVLDYHATVPGRCQWIASFPFTPSLEWTAWIRLATNQPIGQKAAIEHLEGLAQDIVSPASSDVLNLLRSLRANVSSTADTELNPDGGSHIAFSQTKTIKSGPTSVDLPSTIQIAIPVLKGHRNNEGQPVRYELSVRVRATVDDSAHLALRFLIENAERALEIVYADRVEKARALFLDNTVDQEILRAAD